jgi:ABC-2 type transport system permease protein
VKISLTGLYLGQVLVAVLGVLAVGGEYGTGMIGVTFTAMPRLLVVLTALLALGITAAVRDSGVAIGIILGPLFVFRSWWGCFPTTCSPGTWSRPAR